MIRFSRKTSLLAFPTRSIASDEQETERILRKVRRAIDNARVILKMEVTGLTNRIDTARAMASIIVGTGYDDYHTREYADVAVIRTNEDEMKRASGRLFHLRDKIERLERVRAAFDEQFPDSAHELTERPC